MTFTNCIISKALDFERNNVRFVEMYGNQILLFIGESSYQAHLALIELDFEANKCKFINICDTRTPCFCIFIDQKNKNRFFMYEDRRFGYFGMIENNRIYVCDNGVSSFYENNFVNGTFFSKAFGQ